MVTRDFGQRKPTSIALRIRYVKRYNNSITITYNLIKGSHHVGVKATLKFTLLVHIRAIGDLKLWAIYKLGNIGLYTIIVYMCTCNIVSCAQQSKSIGNGSCKCTAACLYTCTCSHMHTCSHIRTPQLVQVQEASLLALQHCCPCRRHQENRLHLDHLVHHPSCREGG